MSNDPNESKKVSPTKADNQTHNTMASGKIEVFESQQTTQHKQSLELIEGFAKPHEMNMIEQTKEQLDSVISGLDEKLNRVLAKQEYEYLKGYNLYVKRKERELRELIERLNEKNSNNTLKDEKIINLERTIFLIRDDQIKMEKTKDQMAEEIKKLKAKSNNMEQERDFLQQQVLESKRQNKLLKMAINRLQSQLKDQGQFMNLEAQNFVGEGYEEHQGDTFLTETKQQPVDNAKELNRSKEKDLGISTMSKPGETQAQTSYIGA